MLDNIDVIECWHPRNDVGTADHYTAFALKHGLLMTSGSNCHQKLILLGSIDIPDFVAKQFTG